MKVEFIKAMSDSTWGPVTLNIPEGEIPDKFTRGSTKWNRHATKFAEAQWTVHRESDPLSQLYSS